MRLWGGMLLDAFGGMELLQGSLGFANTSVLLGVMLSHSLSLRP